MEPDAMKQLMDELFDTQPYALDKKEKSARLTKGLACLTRHHYQHCGPYRNILEAVKFDSDTISSSADIPFMPVRLFKELDLLSIEPEDVLKTMTSSGTSGQRVSKIYLDKETAALQQKILSKIVTSFIGKKRLPTLIIDTASVLKNRKEFSARGAGILGFSLFSSDRAFALDDNMNLNHDVIEQFLKKHEGKTILLFGFTFMIRQHFYQELNRSPMRYDLSDSIMIHGGGWKKLIKEAVSAKEFKESLNRVCGISRIHEYYGMVEQTGSIYMECEKGRLHSSIYSDVIIRRSHDFSQADVGETGIIEVVSLIPKSYPGHALLTEDEGMILGEDDCGCGRAGKYFKVAGRLKNVELRGCSDTYAEEFTG